MSWPWNELGLSGPAGLPEIRRAYAQRLKTTHPEEDPEGFQRLHAAYQEASRYARRSARTARPETPPESVPEPEGEKRPREEVEPPESPEEWERAYDEPLEDQEARSPEKAERPPEPEWDRGEPREDGPAEPEPPEKEGAADWDYERLFAEGEAEAREARLRKMEELRRKNRARYARQEREQRKRAADEEEAWAGVCAAAHALELLYEHGASRTQWQRFLNDPVFWNVRANLDFVFALEDFLEQHPDLSPDIRRAIFAAYERENGSRYPEYKRLYRLLNVDRREKRQMARDKSAWRNAWRSYPPWRKAIIVICFSILAVFFLVAIGASVRDAYRGYVEKREAERWEAQSLAWLEEDFGEPFVHPLGGHKEICAPADDPTLYFWISKDGERTGDWPGYRTDYPHIMLKRELEAFAEEWELGLRFDSAGGGYRGEIGEAPGAYLFDLPLQGAGEAITALGALLDDLETRDWYRVLEDRYNGKIVYQIFLCHGELSFYDAVSTEGDGFDADYARARYETEAGAAFCRYILEQSGLAERHMGPDAYVLLDQGTVEIGGETFFQVTGADKESYEPLVQYLMAGGGRMVFCLPDGKLDSVRGITDLYRGGISHEQLDGVGLVMIWDQV